jgi:hypothetical protein
MSPPARAQAGHGLNSRAALSRVAVARAASFALMLMSAHVAMAQGAEDAPDLMQTLVAEDATLNNNLNLIQVRWIHGPDGRELALGFGVEKIVAKNLGLEVMSEWADIDSNSGRSGAGFGNVDLTLKYVVWKDPERDFQIAFTPAISVRTSSRIGNDDLSSSAGMGISWGGRLNFLRNAGWKRYFRAIEFQGDLGYSRDLGGSSADDFYFDPEIDYSFPYLTYASAPKVPWPLRNLCIFAEFNFDRPLSSPNDGPRTFVTPGVAYLNDYLQITTGIQIALNRAASTSEKTALIASVTISLDSLYPVFARTLF